MSKRQRPGRGVVEAFTAFEMTLNALLLREQSSSLVSDQLD